MRDFHQLKVWEKAHALALSVYRVTGTFPREEQYGLTSQMRRACASVPTRIAEGCGRDSHADMARLLYMALGSASELEYQLLLARDLHLLDATRHEELTTNTIEVKRMLTGLIHKLRTDG